MLLTLPYVGGVESILVDARSALAIEASARMNENATTTYTTETTATRPNKSNSNGIDPSDRERVVLDNLRIEVRRLAEATERQNELLEELLEGESGV